MVEGGRLTFHAVYTGGWEIHYCCSMLSYVTPLYCYVVVKFFSFSFSF
jgi:hypothetical protein